MTSPRIAAAVVTSAGRVLLIRRRVAEGQLLWSLAGGKVEAGETASQAAAREALEEAGVTVAPVCVLGERVHPVSGRRLVYVACRLLAGEARAASPREVAEVRWVRLDELPGLVPGGLYGPVQGYSNVQLLREGAVMAEEPAPGPLGTESRRVTFPDGTSGIMLLQAGLSQDEADLIAAQVWAELPDPDAPEE